MINRNLKIVFMGTPEFAVPALEILADAGYPIVGVITSPDKPGGRGLRQLMISPVKSFAQSRGIKVLQPLNLKSPKFLKELEELNADLQVVVAFRMLPEAVWNMPRLGTMNLHGSLLPAYRGAAPIQWAIIRGEKTTGLTTFMLQHEIDEGRILKQLEIQILEHDDAGSLHDRMMYAGSGLVLGSVDLIQSCKANFVSQDEQMASFAPKIHHEDGHIHWEKTYTEINNLVRGMAPYPGAWTLLDGLELKIYRTSVFSQKTDRPHGLLVFASKKLIVQCKDGELEILEVQLAGKKKMSAKDFINGYKIRNLNLT
ncbi:MAG: methionyl-tRNA formyltransferase [Saprospiraceae bacterium]|uniref:Methionyl-tRNA formyltransferase n=1 Tax=Candidatus Opimibacter skivensis TaxID=2982028 RepID=A0A9D7SV02_9BACT|nr:methionyl-tRNA formyltransferase [Candidatus Opimibacter skivensis]